MKIINSFMAFVF